MDEPETTEFRCKSCGSFVGDYDPTKSKAELVCPKCRSRAVDIVVSMEDTYNLREMVHDSVEMKMKPAAGGKSVLETFDGDDQQVSTGKWMTKERVIDRRNDRYFEKVVDPDTGQTVHHCDEPLSQHRGHGSAKKKQ